MFSICGLYYNHRSHHALQHHYYLSIYTGSYGAYLIYQHLCVLLLLGVQTRSSLYFLSYSSNRPLGLSPYSIVQRILFDLFERTDDT